MQEMGYEVDKVSSSKLYSQFNHWLLSSFAVYASFSALTMIPSASETPEHSVLPLTLATAFFTPFVADFLILPPVLWTNSTTDFFFPDDFFLLVSPAFFLALKAINCSERKKIKDVMKSKTPVMTYFFTFFHVGTVIDVCVDLHGLSNTLVEVLLILLEFSIWIGTSTVDGPIVLDEAGVGIIQDREGRISVVVIVAGIAVVAVTILAVTIVVIVVIVPVSIVVLEVSVLVLVFFFIEFLFFFEISVVVVIVVAVVIRRRIVNLDALSRLECAVHVSH
mmetsp:Transcript_3836/g.8878  ORF Transcript_3836/g.8878 Transcript_3836/m.8878 type:complete len:278 (+) Transcript_3836:93-926(+)